MLKLCKNHTFYEVWNEWAAESVYVDHKPTKDEIQFLVRKVWGDYFRINNEPMSICEFIRRYVVVNKERRVYTADDKRKS